MSNSTGVETPLQEAISIISIISILVSVACYLADVNQVPVVTPLLWWVAWRVYEFLPALTKLPGAQVPVLAASAAMGIAFFVFTIHDSPRLLLGGRVRTGWIRKHGSPGNAAKAVS